MRKVLPATLKAAAGDDRQKRRMQNLDSAIFSLMKGFAALMGVGSARNLMWRENFKI